MCIRDSCYNNTSSRLLGSSRKRRTKYRETTIPLVFFMVSWDRDLPWPWRYWYRHIWYRDTYRGIAGIAQHYCVSDNFKFKASYSVLFPGKCTFGAFLVRAVSNILRPFSLKNLILIGNSKILIRKLLDSILETHHSGNRALSCSNGIVGEIKCLTTRIAVS